MDFKNNEFILQNYTVNNKSLNFNKPLVMAIVNITKNSFYDGNKYGSVIDVLKDIELKIEQGADVIDVGAASTKSGEELIKPETEWEILSQNIKTIRKTFPNIILSVDTYNSQTAQLAVNEGVDIINDISGGNFDKKMFETVAKNNIVYVIMHIKGTPNNMQLNPNYKNVIDEVYTVLEDKITHLKKLNFNKIIIDPGFGFGKSVDDNFKLLKNLIRFKNLGYPILAGLSRKSMINNVINTNPATALNGTTALNTMALLNGAKILRVHDVIEAKQTIQLFNKYQSV